MSGPSSFLVSEQSQSSLVSSSPSLLVLANSGWCIGRVGDNCDRYDREGIASGDGD